MNTSDKHLANQALWQERLLAQASSGKTVAQFCRDTAVTADVILDHLAEVKVDHLSEDGGFRA
jgi:hypothetical protein